jgi:5'/3'-nucleotidase
MRVLVTNDDGIGAPGIAALARGIEAAGHTSIVAAPAEDMSGASASIMRVHRDAHIEVARADLGSDGVEAWCADATPALAVLGGALGAFGEPPDVVVSGINAGLNTGLSVLHSGTVGAALTAQRLGFSAMAVSLEPGDPWRWRTAVEVAIHQLDWLSTAPQGTMLNINVPDRPTPSLETRWAPLDPCGTVRVALADEESGRLQLEMRASGEEPSPSADAALVAAGYVTLTAIGGVHERAVPRDVTEGQRRTLEHSVETLPPPLPVRIGERQHARPTTR